MVGNFSNDEKWAQLLKPSHRKESVAFDGTAFKKVYPEIHAKFSVVKESWKYELVTPDAKLEEIQSVDLDIESIKEDPIELHQKFLEIWAAKAELNWEEKLLESALICACSGHAEIEGVFAWVEKPRSSFDKAAMLTKHPEFEE